MNSKSRRLLTAGTALALAAPLCSALALEESISFGAWLNYEYNNDSDAHSNTLGDLNYESFNIYAHHEHDDWFFNSELRFGEGSFQSFSGDGLIWGFKELAFGRHYGEEWTMTVGKTAVPFTYSRKNFWPGERMISGFGDQRNLGVRLDYAPTAGPLDMSLMFVKNQNFGADTTSLDDGTLGHWGSNDTYRKINTLVADFGLSAGEFRHGLSVQAGQLANQAGTVDAAGTALEAGEETETHWAVGLYTQGAVGSLDLAGQLVNYNQGDTDAFDAFDAAGNALTTQGAGQVAMVSAGRASGDWYTYGDWSMRAPDSDFDRDDTMDLVLGTRYDYGPGWIYTELLLTNLTAEDDPVDSFYTRADEGKRNEVVFLTMDYYF